MSHQLSAASFRVHLETLVRSTSAGALCDTDEEALLALEKKYGSGKQRSAFTDADVEQYLHTQWQDLEDDAANDEGDRADEEAQEPEVLQWLRRWVTGVLPSELPVHAEQLSTGQYPPMPITIL